MLMEELWIRISRWRMTKQIMKNGTSVLLRLHRKAWILFNLLGLIKDTDMMLWLSSYRIYYFIFFWWFIFYCSPYTILTYLLFRPCILVGQLAQWRSLHATYKNWLFRYGIQVNNDSLHTQINILGEKFLKFNFAMPENVLL